MSIFLDIKMTAISIIGGGMVGLLAANALTQSGFEVSVVEKDEKPDRRVSAITPVSVKFFKLLGVWEEIQKHKPSPFYKLKADDLIFDGNNIGEKPLGYIIENNIIRDALRNKFINKKFDSYNLIIAADGANSETRKKAGIECDVKDYHQKAAVFEVKTEKPHGKIARQVFLPTGPLAFLPLYDEHHCSIVWTNPQENIQEAFGDELGKITEVTERLSFPLKMQQAKNYCKERLVLIGDAAHTIHPLAGYGVNMGFLDAMVLTRIVKQAREKNRDIGLLHTLRKYERERKTENLFMLKIIDSFTNNNLRKIGMRATQQFNFLQNFFMAWMSQHGKENSVI